MNTEQSENNFAWEQLSIGGNPDPSQDCKVWALCAQFGPLVGAPRRVYLREGAEWQLGYIVERRSFGNRPAYWTFADGPVGVYPFEACDDFGKPRLHLAMAKALELLAELARDRSKRYADQSHQLLSHLAGLYRDGSLS